MPVANWVCRCALARCQACSSTPRALHIVQPGGVVDQRSAVLSDRAHHRVPAHAQRPGGRRDRVGVLANPPRRPRPCAAGQASPSPPPTRSAPTTSSSDSRRARQRQIRLHHNTNTGRSPCARSRNRCSRRACGAAGRAQVGQGTRAAVVSTSSSSSPADLTGRQDTKSGQTKHDRADIGRAGTVNSHWDLLDLVAWSLRILRSQYLISQHHRSTACRR